MKKISLLALAALLCAGLAMTACKGKGGNTTGEPAAAAESEDIAWTIYQLIPKADLPEYCRDLHPNTDEDQEELEPGPGDFFFASVQGSEIGMDGGFYGYFNLKCYPFTDGGWRAYWTSYGGYDGLCGYDESGAYNYIDGKLTKEETALLPTPDVYQLITATLENSLKEHRLLGEISDPHPNYFYDFTSSADDDILTVQLDLDYLLYMEDDELEGDTLDADYRWNGERLVRLDDEDF